MFRQLAINSEETIKVYLYKNRREILAEIPLSCVKKITRNLEEIDTMDIEVEMIKGSTFTIKNKLTKDTLYISDLEVGDKFRIYGDTKEIVCFNNENKNLFKPCNRQFNVLTMRYGLNSYHIVAEECKVKIIYQSQLCFQ